MKKISRWEAALLAAAGAALLLMAGFFWGRSTAGEGYTISAGAVPSASLAPSPSPSPAEGSPSPAAAPSPAGKVDINTATAEELETLPSIGEVRAQAIVADREANGPFLRVEDLLRVEGIGEGILEEIRGYITVE